MFLYVLVTFIPFERRKRQRAMRDHRAQNVQEILVTNPRVVEIGLINDNEPILAFDIGESKILFLQGQWLRDNETYGAEFCDSDEGEEFINGLPPPHSFPSSQFTITRLPHSGEVIRISVAGEYLEPEAIVEALRPEYEFGDSELFDGELGHVAEILAREHESRILHSIRP